MQKLYSRLHSNLVKLQEDRSGSILPIFAIMAILLIVIGGAAVDVSRSVSAREKLSYALDASALALATELSTRIMTDAEIKKTLEDSFTANLGDAEFLDEALANLDFKVDTDAGTVTVSSSAKLKNYFISMAGYMNDNIGPEYFKFGTNSQVSFSRFDVELALVVDVTGSMAGHIGDLKKASNAVLDILIPEKTSDGKVKISLIPYSVGVNLGTYASKATANLSTRCATERNGTNQYTDVSYSVTPIGDGSGSYRGQNCSSSEILPLTNDRGALASSIKALSTDGYTAGQTGIGWGWYTLSPNWSDLWPSTGDPAPYSDDDVLKFALIMTDGDFNTHYDLETLTKKECNKKKDNGEYSGTCLNGTNDYWLEKPQSGFYGESSKRAIELCKQMKNNDIQIYSVYFGKYNSSDGAKVMQACAVPGNYYQATNSSQLINAFSNIAKKIQQIYLSK